MRTDVEQELQDATDRILRSNSRRKLVVAGPGTGKTYLFRKLLEAGSGKRDERLVLTFIRNLKDDLERSLGELAQTFTLHGYCQHLLYRHAELRDGLSAEFRCYPSLVSLIKKDWQWLRGSTAPKFVEEMRNLECPDDNERFYVERAKYYDAVDFDDSVYRTYRKLVQHPNLVPEYEQVLIDEFQDFNKMEAAIIDLLADRNVITVAGDDDQALYSQLRGASWDYIRSHHGGGKYDVFNLPFCMRCTEVIVEAVNDVIRRARSRSSLEGRIDKPYRFYEPKKGADSRRYPKIDLVQTSVQRGRGNANYIGRYIEREIRAIPEADLREANENHEPVALIIGSTPYRPQIKDYLVSVGLLAPDEQVALSERDKGLEILHENPESNLGWRIILASGEESVAEQRVCLASEQGVSLIEVFPQEERMALLQEAEAAAEARGSELEVTDEPNDALNIQLTTYEGSKGLSAQYVFLVGLHDGELPRDPSNVKDLEICKFVVALTRTKKKCTLMWTKRFGDKPRNPSSFLKWIDQRRFRRINIDKGYW